MQCAQLETLLLDMFHMLQRATLGGATDGFGFTKSYPLTIEATNSPSSYAAQATDQTAMYVLTAIPNLKDVAAV